MSDLVALKAGTILADDYRIERTLGAGGFGITYLAEEIALGRRVTIKEYFPVDFAARNRHEDVVARSVECEGDYSWGLDRFLAEAQTLAKFNHPNIVRVYRYFPARNTGFIVLHFEEGKSLRDWLRGLGRAPRQHELDRIIEPLLAALETVHAADYLHRDIAPDNIMIRPDGQPVLIDFGSARGDIAKHSKTISALVKSGYSPYEQYATTSTKQGPWTDIYSLGATLYEAVTGKRPPDAPSRMVADEMVAPQEAALSSYRPRFLAAIAKALKLEIGERPKTVAEWRNELLAPVEVKAKAAKKSAKSPEPEFAEVGAAVDGGARPAPAAEVRQTPPPLRDDLLPPKPAKPGGLAQAFLDGWRKANAAADYPPKKPEPEAKAAPVPEPPPVVKPAAPKKEPAKPDAPVAAASASGSQGKPATPVSQAAVSAPAEPGARKATPRAIRKRATGFSRKAAAYLLLAVGLAGGIVAVQDYVPKVRREGGGVLTSESRGEVAITVLKGHRGPVSGVAYTPDGQSLVTASADGTLKVWNSARGSLSRTFELDSGAATALAVAQGRAATGHQDGTVALWDLASGSKLATFRRNDSPILSLVFLGRPDRVAASSADRAIAVWDASQQGAPQRVLEGHEDASRALAYASRGPFLASGSADHTVKLWNLDKGELVRTYRGHGEQIAAVAFDPDGRTLATAGSDGQIRLWSTYANRMKRRLTGHEGSIPALAFAADGDHIVSGGVDGTIRVWEVSGRSRPVRTTKDGVPVTALGLAPDGRHIAAAGSDGNVRVLEAALSKEGS
ncbi:MAG: protein kinase [Proteobacteria bacterium]|nr:protein kinase [Pseudomonadota bacterium]